MSDSHKSRYTREGRIWKDTVYASHSQANARAKRKRLRGKRDRAKVVRADKIEGANASKR